MDSYLIIAPQGLGDALEATVIAGALRRARKDARIDAAVLRPGPKELFEQLDGAIDAVLYYPFWEHGALAFVAALARSTLKRQRYDASLLAYPASRPEYDLLARLHGATLRISHDYSNGSARHRASQSEIRIPVAPKHNVERNLDLVRALGIDVAEPPSYLVPGSWKATSRSVDRIAIHIGTVTHHGLANKRWALDRFIELALRLRTSGFEIGVVAGPDERDGSKRLVDSVSGATLIEGTLDEIARYLSGCACAVTNDSGIGHLAAAVGTKVIALHGPTPVEGGPYGANAMRLRPSPCPPCFDPRLRNTKCALNIDFACLKRDLTVDIVEAAILGALGVRVKAAWE